MLASSVPLQALAAVSETKHNTLSENQEILEALEGLTGARLDRRSPLQCAPWDGSARTE